MSSKLALRLALAGLIAAVVPACGNINDGHPAVPFTVLASVSTAGALANKDVFTPRLSGDGRFVVFVSAADTLVALPTGGFKNVFRRTLATGVTELVSIGIGGVAGDGDSLNPSISQDGRWVAFDSEATNLTGVAPGARQVYLRDMNAAVDPLISMVSEVSPGVPGDQLSAEPSISADGRYVAFTSLAENFGDAHTNGATNIYRRDMAGTEVLLVSANTSGGDPTPTGDGSKSPSISADGSVVAYVSDCSDLVAFDINDLNDVFVTTIGGSLTTILASPGATFGGGAGESVAPAISADGLFVAFESLADDLVSSDVNFMPDVFLFDVAQGTVAIVSVNADGFQGATATEQSHLPSVSADGRFVAFESTNSNLVVEDINQAVDVFIKDMTTGSVTRVSVDTSGQQAPLNVNSANCYLSADGRSITFITLAAFVNNDLNGLFDCYVRAPLR
jgi:Tol biopolymer transport system component